MFLIKNNIKENTIYLIAIILASLGVLIDWFRDNHMFNSLLDIYFSIFQTTRNGFFKGFPYIVIGISIAQKGVLNLRVLYSIFILAFAAHMFGFKLATFIMTYALFSIIIQYDFKSRSDNLYRNFRLTSTVVYFVHMIWVGIFLLLCPIKISNVCLFLLVAICSLLTSCFVIKNKDNRFVKLCFR